MSTLKVTNIQDTSGGNSSTSEEIYNGRAKVWVNFNGTGTVAIRASFNVNTITDNSTGNYTVNFSNSMSDANYCAMVSPGNNAGGGQGSWCTIYDDVTTLSGSCRVATYSNSGTFQDTEQMFFAVFR